MFTIPIENEGEDPKVTRAFIDSKMNWDVAKQLYKKPEAEYCKVPLSGCKVYWRGEYLILQHEDIIHYHDSFPCCYLKQAVEFMELDKPAKWKTIDKLISLRMGIRQTEVNCCGYVEEMLEGRTMTQTLYHQFMRRARAQDVQHHGSATF